MRIIGNLLWWLFGGLEAAIGYFTGSLALEFTLADFRRFVGLPHASVLRLSLMYNDHRHSLGKTAFQDGRAFAHPIRQGCGVGILNITVR